MRYSPVDCNSRVHETLQVTPALEARIANHACSIRKIAPLLG